MHPQAHDVFGSGPLFHDKHGLRHNIRIFQQEGFPTRFSILHYGDPITHNLYSVTEGASIIEAEREITARESHLLIEALYESACRYNIALDRTPFDMMVFDLSRTVNTSWVRVKSSSRARQLEEVGRYPFLQNIGYGTHFFQPCCCEDISNFHFHIADKSGAWLSSRPLIKSIRALNFICAAANTSPHQCKRINFGLHQLCAVTDIIHLLGSTFTVTLPEESEEADVVAARFFLKSNNLPKSLISLL